MKKLVFAAIAVLGLTNINTANAQQGFSISAKGIPQASFIINEDDRDNKAMDISPMLGVAFGVGAGYNFNHNFGIGVDVLYSMQGQKYEMGGADLVRKINYIKVPVMFTYTTKEFGIVSFVGKVGPQISMLASSKLTNDDGNDVIDDMNDQYEDITIGGVANLGAQFRVADKIYVTGGLRFDMDFTNAENEDYTLYPAGRETANNMTAGVELGVKFKF